MFSFKTLAVYTSVFGGVVSSSDRSASGCNETQDFIYLIAVNREYSISVNGSRAGSPRTHRIRLQGSLGELQTGWCLELIQLQELREYITVYPV